MVITVETSLKRDHSSYNMCRFTLWLLRYQEPVKELRIVLFEDTIFYISCMSQRRAHFLYPESGKAPPRSSASKYVGNQSAGVKWIFKQQSTKDLEKNEGRLPSSCLHGTRWHDTNISLLIKPIKPQQEIDRSPPHSLVTIVMCTTLLKALRWYNLMDHYHRVPCSIFLINGVLDRDKGGSSAMTDCHYMRYTGPYHEGVSTTLSPPAKSYRHHRHMLLCSSASPQLFRHRYNGLEQREFTITAAPAKFYIETTRILQAIDQWWTEAGATAVVPENGFDVRRKHSVQFQPRCLTDHTVYQRAREERGDSQAAACVTQDDTIQMLVC